MTRRLIMPLAAVAVAGLALLAGIALAKGYTLLSAQAKVTDRAGHTTTETIVVNGAGFALYELSGDSARHPKCVSSQCRRIWPPATVGAHGKVHAGSGVKGKLGIWRHNGIAQVTLGGHPLYTFSADKHRHAATGQGIKSFGGTWHVVRASGGASGMTTTEGTTTQTTSTEATTSTCTGYYC